MPTPVNIPSSHLLNLASEMVIARSVLNQVGVQFEEQMAQSELVRRARESHLQISKLISELQKNVLRMRMVTIDTIFKRFARPMRQLAHESGKRVELEMLGGETELDRALHGFRSGVAKRDAARNAAWGDFGELFGQRDQRFIVEVRA